MMFCLKNTSGSKSLKRVLQKRVACWDNLFFHHVDGRNANGEFLVNGNVVNVILLAHITNYDTH